MNKLILTLLGSAAIGAVAVAQAQAGDWYPYPVEVWDPPFNMESPRTTVEYTPLDKASKPWRSASRFRT